MGKNKAYAPTFSNSSYLSALNSYPQTGPTLPRIRYICFDLAHAPVATTARAAATGPVSMSTRPDPEGSDTVEIATRRCPRLRVVWDLRELTH